LFRRADADRVPVFGISGERAERFRAYRRRQPLAVCYRCGAKYMSKPWTEYAPA
jgi:hypothetical protein